MSSKQRAERGRPGPRRRFTQHQVVSAALRLVDESPPEAVTMSRLAGELGIGVMTLYGYVCDKDDLLGQVTALALDEAHSDTEPDKPWTEQLRRALTEMHDVCRRHPNLVTLVLERASSDPALFRWRERILSILVAADFEPATALHALGSLSNYVLGFANAQSNVAPLQLPDRMRQLPREEFPHLTACADRYAEHLSNDAFDYGITLLLRGLAADHPTGGGHD